MGCGTSTEVLVSPRNNEPPTQSKNSDPLPVAKNQIQQNVDCKTTAKEKTKFNRDSNAQEEIVVLEENVNVDDCYLVQESNLPIDDPEIGIPKNRTLVPQQEAIVNNSGQSIEGNPPYDTNKERRAIKQQEQLDIKITAKKDLDDKKLINNAVTHEQANSEVELPAETEQDALSKISQNPDKPSTDPGFIITTSIVKSETKVENISSQANKPQNGSNDPEKTAVSLTNNVEISKSTNTRNSSRCSNNSSESSFVDIDAAENLLSGILVNDVIASLTTEPISNSPRHNEQHDKGEDGKILTKHSIEAHSEPPVEEKQNPAHELLVEKVEKKVQIIAPSSGPSVSPKPVFKYSDTEDDIKLHAYMRLACNITDNQQLISAASKANALYLERSLSVVAEIVAAMPILKKLDISGNHSGPVSVRAILTVLTAHNCVEYLDLSDNMADAECAEHLGRFISSSKNLRWLNIASNNFGKESLNRCLSTSVSASESLTYLDVSGCGAINLHGLFEAIRQGYSNSTLPLSYLDISNNHVNDGQQLGIDLSLILENSNCCLTSLNLNSIGLNACGWETLATGVQGNSSLTGLNIGGSQNETSNLNSLVKMIAVSNTVDKLCLAGVKLKDEQPFGDDPLPPLQVKNLDVSNCGLVDEVFVKLAKSSPGCLGRLEVLNLTGNVEISSLGLEAVDIICSGGASSNVKSLTLSLLDVEYLPSLLAKCFLNLTSLNLRKSRITPASLISLSTIPQTLKHFSMDGIKLSNTGVLSAILGSESKHHFETLGLGNCGITDTDAMPVSEALGHIGSPLQNLCSLDLSSNRLTESTLVSMADHLTRAPNHPLKMLDVSNNAIKDNGADVLSKSIMSASSYSSMQTVSIANNHLTCPGLTSLVSAFRSGEAQRGLVSLDVSNQKTGLDDDETNDILTSLASALGIDIEGNNENIPALPVKLIANLTGLGGSVSTAVKALNSAAIKTDFSKVCQDSAKLGDFLYVGAGLEKNMGLDTTEKLCASFSSAEWSGIIGSDAPAWLKVDKDRQRGVYINQLPATATVQRLEGMLEMEADCQVSDVYIVKDPIMRKPTGAAWVLFATDECVQKVLNWCCDGEAVMYGTAFSVSRLLVDIVDEQQGAQTLAKRDLIVREQQRKENELKDQKMLEESQKLADERAAYREAHPAYQDGRIW